VNEQPYQRDYAIIWQALTDYINSGIYAPDNVARAEELRDDALRGMRNDPDAPRKAASASPDPTTA